MRRTSIFRNVSSYIRDSSASRPQNDKACVILSEATCPLVEVVATRRLCRLLPLSHASRRAAVGSTGTLHACARPIDNDSVSACAPGTACRASTLRCVVISLRTGFSASYFLRLAMPVQVLRTFPATARCALVSPASLLGAPFLLRKTAPFSRPRRQSQFCPLRGTPRIPCAERRSAAALPSAAWPVYIDFACVVG